MYRLSVTISLLSFHRDWKNRVKAKNQNIDNSVFFNEPGRWTVEYSYTDDDGQVIEWGEAVDVQEEEDEADTPSAYEAGIIFATALVVLIGMILIQLQNLIFVKKVYGM